MPENQNMRRRLVGQAVELFRKRESLIRQSERIEAELNEVQGFSDAEVAEYMRLSTKEESENGK